MKLKTIVQVMTLTLSVTVVGGVYFLYQQWNNSIRDEALHHATSIVNNLHDEISIYFDVQSKPVKTITELPAILRAFEGQSKKNLSAANLLLDTFCSTLDALTCYMMDDKGTTIASSNRNTRKSFIGKNYSFRPYFKEALSGIPSVYLALGVTSKKRGIYFSHPVIKENVVQGVVVVKFSVERLEQKFENLNGIAILGDKDGMVFATNRKEWLFKSLWKLSSRKAETLATTRQFGNAPPTSIGLLTKVSGEVTDENGNHYLSKQKTITSIPDWKVLYFYNTDNLLSHQNEVIKRVFGSGIGWLLLLLAGFTFYLYVIAKNELRIRELSEHKMVADKQVAQLANQAKSEFLSRISHEFRTPLNSILGFGQILEMNSEQLNQSQQDNVKDIVSSGNYLLKLMDEILEMAKIESGSLDIHIVETSINDLLRDSLDSVGSEISASNIELIDKISAKHYNVLADETRLKEVLCNLLSNAVKFNSSPGCITLSAEIVEHQCLRINVSDTGDGLSASDIDRLFYSFDRLIRKDTDEKGVGLLISKGLIDLMDGRIGVKSQPGIGSTFWIELKLA